MDVKIDQWDLGDFVLDAVRYRVRARENGLPEDRMPYDAWMAEKLRRVWSILDGSCQRKVISHLEMEVMLGDQFREVPKPHLEEWRELTESLRPPKAPFTVKYQCGKCKAKDLKLWRGVHGCSDDDGNELLCAKCLAPGIEVDPDGRASGRYDDKTDQVGGWLPAVPVDDTFWGYGSVPTADVRWWRALPTYRDR